MAKIIVFNGPPRCGKDTAAETVVNYFGSDFVSHLKFSTPLKEIVSSVTGQEHAAMEEIKDDAKVFSGTYRELQIGVFQALSQVFSSQWLGEVLVHKITREPNDLIVCSDGGRTEELLPLFRRGHEIMVVQILRDNCHFGYDIRGYISSPKAVMRAVVNKDISTFRREVIDIAGEFFGNG